MVAPIIVSKGHSHRPILTAWLYVSSAHLGMIGWAFDFWARRFSF